MIKIAFRCDASIQIGSGHVMRCLTLANELREQGAEITFICREHPGHLFGLIESSNHRLLRLPFSAAVPKGKLPHAHWLSATQTEDAHQTVDALEAIGHIDWLIIDHYALDAEWETAMRACTKRIMVIDDLADRVHDCDVLLDQNLHRADMETRYEKLVPPSCKRLLGPRYALLRPEFQKVRANLRIRDGSVKRILVFLGGTDPTNETCKVLQAIKQLARADIATDVVIGSANPHQEGIVSLCAQLTNAKLHCQVNNMAELMASADIAIGAGGSTTWERCALGLPALVISVADNQVSIAKGVEQANAQIYLGTASEITSTDIAVQIKQFLQNPQKLISMSESGQKLVDLKGANRVIEVIKEAA